MDVTHESVSLQFHFVHIFNTFLDGGTSDAGNYSGVSFPPSNSIQSIYLYSGRKRNFDWGSSLVTRVIHEDFFGQHQIDNRLLFMSWLVFAPARCWAGWFSYQNWTEGFCVTWSALDTCDEFIDKCKFSHRQSFVIRSVLWDLIGIGLPIMPLLSWVHLQICLYVQFEQKSCKYEDRACVADHECDKWGSWVI